MGPDHPMRTCTSWDSRRKENLMKSVAFLIFITALTYAQMPASRPSKSDAEKVASAMHAGPKFVTQNATVLDLPSSPGGEFRVIRAGTNRGTCVPGSAGCGPLGAGLLRPVLSAVHEGQYGRPYAQCAECRNFIYVRRLLGTKHVACDG